MKALRMKALRYIILTLAAITQLCAAAQSTDRDCIRIGNRYYRDGNIQKAEVYYRKALEKKKTPEAYYNLGNALVAQARDSSAFEMYKKALDMPLGNTLKKSKIYHNMGNLMYANGSSQLRSNQQEATQSFAQAAELYKSALRCNPDDNETRYNLAKALFQLKKSKSGGGGGGENNKDSKQNKDKNNSKDKDKEKEQKQDNKQDDKNQKDQNKQDKQDKNGMSNEAAEQLLNSAQQDEQKVQRKVQHNNSTKRRQLEKDW